MASDLEDFTFSPAVATELDGGIAELVETKARELFAVCDKEGKGFINRGDMQRLHGELPLSDDQLREVFDRLDEDGNGFLTFQEFCDGFGGFLGLSNSYDSPHENSFTEETSYTNPDTCEQEPEETNLPDLIKQLTADSSVQNNNNRKEILEIWNKMQDEDPDEVVSVEEFVQMVIKELNEAREEKQAIEKTLIERSQSHEEEVRNLFEEMEHQIKEERHKAATEEVLRERSLSRSLQNELKRKEEHLQDILTQHQQLEKKVDNLTSRKTQVKSENSQLLQLNESLVEELQKTRKDLEETRYHMEMVKQQKERQEEQEHAETEARRLDVEKKSLINQLEVLREVNRKLRDDKDEAIEQTKLIPLLLAQQRTSTPKDSSRPRTLFTQGSNVGKYFTKDFDKSESLSDMPEEFEAKQPSSSQLRAQAPDKSSDHDHASSNSDSKEKMLIKSINTDSYVVISEDALSDTNKHDSLRVKENPSFLEEATNVGSMPTEAMNNQQRTARFYRKLSHDLNRLGSTENGDSKNLQMSSFQGNSSTSISPRLEAMDGPPDSDQGSVSSPSVPDRIYKVVYVGNSGVGKTSLIQQFVIKRFKPTIGPTIGVDYQMKTIKIGDLFVALQLWDTAGQERYRSITKQYFRKADGVIIVYDVTNEKSFLAVRNWMQSVQEGTNSSAVVILLIGNKNDITDRERQVTPKEGAKLAEEYGALFAEMSARSGHNVSESMMTFAEELTKLEDEQRESVLSLTESEENKNKLKTCCSGKNR